LARARLAVEEDRGQMARTELAIEQTPNLLPNCLDAGALTDQFLQERVQSSTTTTSGAPCSHGSRSLKIRYFRDVGSVPAPLSGPARCPLVARRVGNHLHRPGCPLGRLVTSCHGTIPALAPRLPSPPGGRC